MIRPLLLLAWLLPFQLLPFQTAASAAVWNFVEIARQAGLDYEHGFGDDPVLEAHLVSGGVAAGDIDGDGWIDLYVVRGSIGPNLLFRNRHDGSFEEIGSPAGLALLDGRTTGPTFADLDGDGRLDLVVGGIASGQPRLFRNLGLIDGRPRFEEITDSSGVTSSRDTFSSAFGDYDRDGDLDLFLAHWSAHDGFANHLWRNRGDGTFDPVDWAAGLAPFYLTTDWTFTPSFADLDNDGWPDLLVTGDFGTSRVFHNRGDGTFENQTGPEISDENGMGTAVGDFDNDGDLDWFVSSIWDPDGTAEGNWGISGNRLYRNRGDGTFVDATEASGLRKGYWGWGSCFADFDNDGRLDLFHTNGIQITGADEFHHDPSRLFIQQADRREITFTERSAELGLDDTGQGRGVVCFDYDRDGDIDIFVAQNSGPPRLYRNDLEPGSRFLGVRLEAPGRQTIGARLTLVADGATQTREIRAGSNYLSQDPAEAHFGLGGQGAIAELRILWPDGDEQVLPDPQIDRWLLVHRGTLQVVDIPSLHSWNLLFLALLLAVAALRQMSPG